MVRRLFRAGIITCSTCSSGRGSGEGRGTGSASLADFVKKLEAPAPIWLMGAGGGRGQDHAHIYARCSERANTLIDSGIPICDDIRHRQGTRDERDSYMDAAPAAACGVWNAGYA